MTLGGRIRSLFTTALGVGVAVVVLLLVPSAPAARTQGDPVSYTAQWVQGPGANQQTLTVKNTGGYVISEFTFTTDDSGVVFVTVNGSPSACSQGSSPDQASCGSALDAGQTEKVVMTSQNPIPNGATGKVEVYNDADVPQTPTTETLEAAGAMHLTVTKTIVAGDRVMPHVYDQDTPITFEIAVHNPNSFRVKGVDVGDQVEIGRHENSEILAHWKIPPGCVLDDTVGGKSVLFKCKNVSIAASGTARFRVTMRFKSGTIGHVAANVGIADDEAVARSDYDTVTFHLVHRKDG